MEDSVTPNHTDTPPVVDGAGYVESSLLSPRNNQAITIPLPELTTTQQPSRVRPRRYIFTLFGLSSPSKVPDPFVDTASPQAGVFTMRAPPTYPPKKLQGANPAPLNWVAAVSRQTSPSQTIQDRAADAQVDETSRDRGKGSRPRGRGRGRGRGGTQSGSRGDGNALQDVNDVPGGTDTRDRGHQHDIHGLGDAAQSSKHMYVPAHLRKKSVPCDTGRAVSINARDVSQHSSSDASRKSFFPSYDTSPGNNAAAPKKPLSPPSTPPVEKTNKNIAWSNGRPGSWARQNTRNEDKDKQKATKSNWSIKNMQSTWDLAPNDEWNDYSAGRHVSPKVAPPHRANGPGWSRPPKKKYVWPKAREMKARPENNLDFVEQRVTNTGFFKYDVKELQDWEGNWNPAPLEWQKHENNFTKTNLGEIVEHWNNGFDVDGSQTVDIDCSEYTQGGNDNHSGYEIVPRYWLPEIIEKRTLEDWWALMETRQPDPCEGDTFGETPPWWTTYINETSVFTKPLAAPDAKLNPEDPDNCSLNATNFTTNKTIQLFMDDRQKKHRRETQKYRRFVPQIEESAIEDNRIKPEANFYIRAVKPADVLGITEIYNYYVTNTVHVSEFDIRSEEQMRDRINGITSAHLPFLVAVDKGARPRGNEYVREPIVGFISIDDYCGPTSMMRYTFEMQILVHPGFTGKRIGTCLLDRTMSLCNPGYSARGGYDYKGTCEGSSRVMKTIILHAFHEHKEAAERTAELKKFSDYLKPFGFIRAGSVTQIGFKKGKVADLAMYQMHTTERIDPESRPTLW